MIQSTASCTCAILDVCACVVTVVYHSLLAMHLYATTASLRGQSHHCPCHFHHNRAVPKSAITMPRSTANNLRTHRPLHDDQGSALISLTTDLGPRTCFLSQLLWNCVWHGQLRQCFGTPTGKSQVDFGEGQNRWGDGQFDARCREYAAPCQQGHAERSDHVYRALLAGSVRFVWRDGRVGAQQIRRRCLHSRLLLVQVAFEHPAVDDRCEERVHQSRRLVGVFCH